MTYTYKTKGTCSRSITIDVIDGVVQQVYFAGGCDGNLKGLASLVKGLPVEEVIARLSGITCGFKKTSCPDQLARALQELQEGDNA